LSQSEESERGALALAGRNKKTFDTFANQKSDVMFAPDPREIAGRTVPTDPVFA
jgi:hypothetical protein